MLNDDPFVGPWCATYLLEQAFHGTHLKPTI